MFRICLKAARVNAGLKQKEVAEIIGIGTATIVSWESGKTSPKAEQLQELCRIYKVPIDCIILNKKSSLSEQMRAG